jgi:predicted porin
MTDVDDNSAAVGTDGENWEVNSNASRLGVRGNEKLSDDFTAVYKAEWSVSGDTAGAADLTGRERYIGLKHATLGTLRLGAIDSPLKTSEDNVDVFNDLTNLDMSNIIYGQERLNNSINYVSPKVLDVFGANITFQPGEGRSPGATATVENHIADAISAAFSYEDDNLYLSVAMDKDVTTTAPSQADIVMGNLAGTTIEQRDALRFVGRYKMGDLTVAGLFQQSEINTTTPNNGAAAGIPADEQAFAVSVSYDMDKLTFKGMIANNNIDGGSTNGISNGEVDIQLIGVGVDYNLSQNTKVFANLASITSEADRFANSVPGNPLQGVEVETMQLGGGIEVRF